MKPSRMLTGAIACAIIAGVYGTIALRGTYLEKAGDIWGDEATYFMMTESLVHDRDLTYRRQDLTRTWHELGPNGANGVFLKKGLDVTGVHVERNAPFVKIDGVVDPEASSRLFFGKSFIYPVFAALFVTVFGTNGFLIFNTCLLVVIFLAAYMFLSARSPVMVSLVLSLAFVFATVVPVYWTWITPELFNCALGASAYFCWLYKFVASDPPARGMSWLRSRESDAVAGVLVGLATFSKVTNVLWLLPMVGWWLYKREWRRAVVVTAWTIVLTVGLFAVNVAVTGDWNYQGGARKTFYADKGFPFADPRHDFDTIDPLTQVSRSDARSDALFDPHVFWLYLKRNAWYFVVGRYGGLVPYYFPAVFAAIALVVARRRASAWQWFVLGGVLIQALTAIFSQPYTYLGSGGAVGDRYFMSNYGVWIFLIPPIRSLWAAVIPALAGGLFVAPLVLRPFDVSLRPTKPADSGPLRMFPVELTNLNDLPLMTIQGFRKRDFYRDDAHGNPGFFQLYYFDDKLGLPEQEVEGLDRPWSVWVTGRARTEFVLKVDPPIRQFKMVLSAGPVGTTATVTMCGQTSEVVLEPHGSKELVIDLCEGFPFRKDLPADAPPHLVWTVSIASSNGFSPKTYEPHPPPPRLRDERYLGVRVAPSIVR